MSDDSFQNLSSKVDDLIDLCAEMKRENQILKANESSLKSEHQKMVERNQEAKSKLQSVLERLKAMDNS
ncbi:MAG: cell division protein ZapB [Proteobacteria bacterium]|jgi:cell division protein ZapB|nr:cell division protein ZapB [Pseudomonadota bacterium]MDA0928608.1 cell division protein ZapB [Pseudomonadota bacterium]